MPSPSAKKTPAAKKTVVRTPAARRAKATAEPAVKQAGKGEALLRAGLKALGEARDGVVQRQTRVVETLLGIPAKTVAPKNALDSLGDALGFRKLEDVFDQRIAAALERLGIPSAEELAELREQVRQLVEERDKAVAALAATAPPAAARRKR